ncbi:MAG TPA: SDR family oxidoreductase [Polyangiaceae bacterium]|nr:SDR family oxidoreductase [Polyangiaceae bacterium]
MTSNPAILVTGASGFLGSRLVKQLVAHGERVKGLVRAGANLDMLQDLPRDLFELTYGDVLIDHSVFRALAGCDRLFHVASNFSMWAPNPETVMAPAVQGTQNVLHAARQRQIERIVVTSSVGVLGTSDGPQSFDESHEFNVSDPETYYVSKLAAQKVVSQAQEQGLPVISVLPAALFGPGDVKPTPNGRLLLNYLRRNPDFRMPVFDGGFNVVDVDDVAMGHVLAMEHGKIGGRYILGGDNITFEQLFATLSDMTGLAGPGMHLGPRTMTAAATLMELMARWTGEAPLISRRTVKSRVNKYLWVRSDRAEHELGYRHRPFKETLDRAIRWFLKRGYLTEQQTRRIWLELRTS